MIITINTDASFSVKLQRGTYAFYIISNLGRIQMSGPLKKKCNRSEVAEIMCILNALAVVAGNKEMVKVASRIIVNTDCLNAIHIFNRDQVKIKKYKLRQMTGYASMYFQKYKPIFGKVNVEFRHVQAHTDKDDARSHVNKKMDNAAKAEMKLLLNKSNPDTNENSPNPNGNQLRGRSNDPAAKRQAQQA